MKQWRAIHVEGQQSDQSDNLANISEVIVNCKAIFYEEGKGGENYRKKNKFHNCLVNQGEKRLVKFRETVW